MTPERSYQSILMNLSRHTPLDLDPLLFDMPRVGGVSDTDFAPHPPSSLIWEPPADGASRIGLRITEPLERADVLAARLASIAIERQIYPVFMSYIAHSGMQRFGFRVEQLFGLTERAQAQFEVELTRFWRFALIIDASDIENLS